MGPYEKYQTLLAPPWLQGPNGGVVEDQFAIEKDVQLDRARQGVLSNIPGQAPVDALPYIGAERKLPQAVGESTNAYAERLRTVWDGVGGWSYAGSHGSLLRALDRAGFPMGDPAGAHIMQRIVRYSWLSASGGSVVYGTHPTWTFDGSDPRLWNQFGLIFGADFTPSFVPGATTFADGDPSARLLNAIVADWKPAKARFMGTWVIVSGPTYGWPVGRTWGSFTWGGGVTRIVKPT